MEREEEEMCLEACSAKRGLVYRGCRTGSLGHVLIVAILLLVVSPLGMTAARGAEGVDAEGVPASGDSEEALRHAEAAEDDAWLAAREVERRERAEQESRALSGPYVGAAFFYAAEDFDMNVIVKSSLGGSGFVGYRFGPLLAAEVRYEGFDSFDLGGSAGRGEIDGYAVTLNGKLYPFGGPIQPFVGLGVGGIRLENDSPYGGPIDSGKTESDVVFRFLGGIDLPVTRYIVINLEGAYLMPGDDLSDLKIGVIGAGLTFQF
jgi:opacity protein-like surface antigen